MSQATASPYESLRIECRNGVDWLMLNRPDCFNALNGPMLDELLRYFDALLFDHAVRVVVLRGAGKHFCAGMDLTEADTFTGSNPSSLRAQRRVAEIIARMRRCPQPIIGLVQGAASGAGLAFALACDVRFAAEDAKFNVAMSKVGLTGCDIGISYHLPRSVGTSNAAEMMMGGRFVDAAKALRIGLVSDVVAPEALQATGQAMAEEMLAMSPLGLRLTKEGLNLAQDAGSLDAALTLEDRGQTLCLVPYMQEGASAFLQKRPARYSDD
jgi:enoyl-CoA hydratase/carnithine racemase